MKRSLIAAIPVSLLAIACGPVGEESTDCIVDEHIEEPTTWSCPTMTVTQTIRVTDHLTVEPGTEVVFAQGAHLEVRADGKLTAEGTADEPIVFAGDEPLKGHWGGISIQTISEDNVLRHVVIRDTGAGGFQGNEWALAILGGGVPEGYAVVADLAVENASGKGVSLGQGAELGEGSTGWHFADVDDSLVRAAFDAAHFVPADISVDGETPREWIEVDHAELDREVTWDSALPYRLTENPRMVDGARLTVVAGNTLLFDQDVNLKSGAGRITIDGTADEPVLLTGMESLPGYWGGIAFQSQSPDNRVSHAVIEYSGGDNFQNNKAAVYVGGSTTSEGLVEISNTVIRASEDVGLWVAKGGAAMLDAVTFEENGGDDMVDKNLE